MRRPLLQGCFSALCGSTAQIFGGICSGRLRKNVLRPRKAGETACPTTDNHLESAAGEPLAAGFDSVAAGFDSVFVSLFVSDLESPPLSDFPLSDFPPSDF